MKNSTKLANDLLLNLLASLEMEKQFTSGMQASILEAISTQLHKIAFLIYDGDTTLSNVISNIGGDLNNESSM